MEKTFFIEVLDEGFVITYESGRKKAFEGFGNVNIHINQHINAILSDLNKASTRKMVLNISIKLNADD